MTIQDRINEIIEAVMQVARGDYSVQIKLSDKNDELDSLAMGVNMMIDDIKETKTELEKRVRERTAELEQSYLASLNIMEDIDRKNKELEDAHNKLKATQTQFIKQSRLASVGELAAGLAHEIGNPLQTILGNAELLLMEKKNEELLAIQRASLHCKKIIENLLDFSRQREMNFVPEDINKLLEKTLSLYGKQLELKKIKIVKNYAKLPDVTVSPSHLEQVFLNLIINAEKAMPKGGTLTITTRVVARPWRAVADQGSAATKEATQGVATTKENELDYIEISFKDTGIGIPKENLSRLFEPFFTTKKDGTGLGLSVSYGIVKQHGGEILAFSDGENKGAEFVVKLSTGGGGVKLKIYEKNSCCGR